MSTNKTYFPIFNKSNWVKLEKSQIESEEPSTSSTSTSSTKTLSKTTSMDSDTVIEKYPSKMNIVPYKDLIQRLRSIEEATTNPPKSWLEKEAIQQN